MVTGSSEKYKIIRFFTSVILINFDIPKKNLKVETVNSKSKTFNFSTKYLKNTPI